MDLMTDIIPTSSAGQMMRGDLLARFDYSDLPRQVTSQLQASAARVRSSNSKILDQVLCIGRELHDAKCALPHGKFGDWIVAEFGWSERTAQNYMRAFEVYGQDPQHVADLPLGILYRLQGSSVPETVRNEVLGLVRSGEHVEEERIKSLIKKGKEAHRDAQKQRARLARKAGKSPEQILKEERAEKRRERADAKRETLHKEEAEAANAVADVVVGLMVRHMPEKLDEMIGLLGKSDTWVLARVFHEKLAAAVNQPATH